MLIVVIPFSSAIQLFLFHLPSKSTGQLRQVQYITGKRKVRVPRVLIQSLTRAIALRRKHGMYAQSQGGQSDSDKSHSHFLGILEYTLEILKPHAPTADDQPGVDRETNPGNDQSEEFENKFSKLELQEPSNKFQQFLDAPDIDRAIRTEVKLGPRYEADLAKDQKEEYAAAHCFFEDIMKLYLFAQGAWGGYKKGSASRLLLSQSTRPSPLCATWKNSFKRNSPPKLTIRTR